MYAKDSNNQHMLKMYNTLLHRIKLIISRISVVIFNLTYHC